MLKNVNSLPSCSLREVRDTTGREIVNADDPRGDSQEAIGEVRGDEPGTPGHHGRS